MDITYGFACEKMSTGKIFVTPATKNNRTNKIRSEDISGFLGSWDARPDTVFFPCETESTLCNIALKKANEYANEYSTNV